MYSILSVNYIHLSFSSPLFFVHFFFNDTPTTEIYTLSLHDALPISRCSERAPASLGFSHCFFPPSSADARSAGRDRKSTRLNSSHPSISYAVFCLKKKKNLTGCSTHLVDHDHYIIILSGS